MSPASAAARCLVALAMAAASHMTFAQGAEPAQARELRQARELAQRGDLARAAEQVDAYVKAHPKDPRGRFLQGVLLAQQNRTDEAMAVYTRITEDYPELPEPYNNLAALHAQKGEFGAARDALERAVRAQPSYATAHENLGDIYARLAASSYARAAELDRGRASAQQKLKIVSDIVTPTSATPGAR